MCLHVATFVRQLKIDYSHERSTYFLQITPDRFQDFMLRTEEVQEFIKKKVWMWEVCTFEFL